MSRFTARTCSLGAFLLGSVLLLAACGGEKGAGGTTAGSPQEHATATPVTKDAVMAHLQGVLKAIQEKDWDAAAAHFQFGPRAPKKEDWPAAFAGMLEKNELSAAGLTILAEKGSFGSLMEVFPERGAAWAERAEVPLERCYALSFDGAEVAVFAGDAGLRIIRLDDVGKLH